MAALGPPDGDRALRRVISPGGGAIVDPRNRWMLYRGRLPVWLDVRPEVLGQRLRRSPNVRPLVQGGDPSPRSGHWRPRASASTPRRRASTASPSSAA